MSRVPLVDAPNPRRLLNPGRRRGKQPKGDGTIRHVTPYLLITLIAILLAIAIVFAAPADAHGNHPQHKLRRIAGHCLSVIIERETARTWNHHIYNYTGSGAYGLPQALPGHKMSSAGADWRTNPLTQIRWMREYARSRYGSDCAALAFHNRNGWY